MAHYHEKIRKTKENDEKIITISVNKKYVFLRPVDLSDETVGLITTWRNKYWQGFLSKFHATEERTRNWLQKDVIGNPDRIFFLIFLDERKIGHIGIINYNETTNSAEIDSVLRGIRDNYSGIMEKVTKGLIKWMLDDLQLSKVQTRVLADNYKAINLYERSGMLSVGIIPLKRSVTKDGWGWEETKLKKEDEYAQRNLIVMEITKEGK